RDTHRAPHLRARTGREDQRQHAHDERHRRHQDRPQPQPARFDRGPDRRAPGEFELAREFDDQDGVLGRQAHQHDQADLGEHVVVPLRQPDPEHRGQEPHRHDHDDRERQRQALIERGEHQEHQQDRQREHPDSGIAGDELLIGQVGP
ncbi:hypothetical protein QU38_01600, partial [Staphylococcus aureus]